MRRSKPVLALSILLFSAVSAFADEVTERVFAVVNAGRVETGVEPLVRRDELDALAESRAQRVSRMPQLERLRDATPIAADLPQGAPVFFRRIVTHTEMVRGYDRPEDGLLASWRSAAAAWKQTVDPAFDAIGLATRRTADGWIVLVAAMADLLPLPPEPAALERAVLEVVNRERRAHGLVELVPSPALAEVARHHSEDMAARGFISHVNPDGWGPADRVSRAGISYLRLSENIHWGQNEPGDPAEAAVEAWLESPGHRRALLDPDVRESGVGAAVSANGSIHLTQLYMRGPSAEATRSSPRSAGAASPHRPS
jgi:uncharacterized protein YkwD